MMTDVEIRQASFDDLDLLLQLRMEKLHGDEGLALGDHDELQEASWQYYSDALTNGSHVACFATTDGKIVGSGGLCLHSEVPSAANPSGRCAFLTDIHVCGCAKDHYEMGRCIAAWLVEYARGLGISKIYLESSVAARYMFHSLGFRGMSDMMMLAAAAV